MYDHLHEQYMNQQWVGPEYRAMLAEQFLDYYTDLKAQDIYRWLWEGEFGPGGNILDLSLDRLNTDLRKARADINVYEQKLWEPSGLSMKILKINIVRYADSGCPLLRLLELAARTRDSVPNTLRFKHNWNFMKTQLISGMNVTPEDMNVFENSIAFHMTPEINYSDLFIENYGLGYRLVPRQVFFKYFPEYEPEELDFELFARTAEDLY